MQLQLNTRSKFHYFFRWKQTKPKLNGRQSVECSPELKYMSMIKHSSRVSQFSYGSASELKSVLTGNNQSSKQMRYSSCSFYDKEETQKLYERLYQHAVKKKSMLEQSRSEVKDKEMDECTFKPEISESNVKSIVYENLTYADMKEKEEILKQQKIRKELEGCTFRPKTNSCSNLLNRSFEGDNSFNHLYKHAEVQRQNIRVKELEQREKELDGCTFKPSVLNPSKSPTGTVYEKLYKQYQDSERKKRKKELEKQAKETDEQSHIPKLITQKKEVNLTPVYVRLYDEVEKRKQKLKKKVEIANTERSVSPSRPKKIDEPQRFELLYALSKSASQRKIKLEEKIMKESGTSFKPDMSKKLIKREKKSK